MKQAPILRWRRVVVVELGRYDDAQALLHLVQRLGDVQPLVDLTGVIAAPTSTATCKESIRKFSMGTV